MSNLDVNTPNGQITLEQEKRAAALFEQAYENLVYAHTPKDEPADVDAVIVQHGKIISIALTSCRDMTLEKLTGAFNHEWLLTFEKILKAREVADRMCVSLIGCLYLVPDDLLLVKKLYEPGKGWTVNFRVARTETQATCNGGAAVRANAFIDMRTFHRYGGKQ